MGLSLTAVSSYGDMFDYSLTLSGGDSVTGTLQGTWSDSSHTYVTGVSNVTLTIGGYQNLDSAGTWIVGTPVVSTVAIDNNFTFSGNTVNLSMGENTGSDYYVEAFYPPGHENPYPAYDDMNNGEYREINWSLTDVTPTSSSVPDGGLSIALFGMALSGLAFIRRRL
jgi:hypothetical protein